MRTRVIALALAAALMAVHSRPQAQAPSTPALVVVLVVDQMRADYLTTFASRWQGGFRELLDRGAVFDEARYPYWSTITCAGHATIATGTLPRTHGMVLNRWWDRDSRRVVACTDDAAAPVVSYGRPAASGHSGARLLRTTLADEIRTQQTGARVVTLSLKPRSAIGLAGHGGDAVTWFDEASVSFVTSKAFAAAPVPEVAAALAAAPFEQQQGAVWTLAASGESYRFADLLPGEQPDFGWTALFPHPLAGRAPLDRTFADHWQKSPLADEHLAHVASTLVDRWRLGQRGVTDFLGVSFSTLDMVGHDFGPKSREVEDILLRLDRTIGALLTHLDRAVGRDRYVLALTADHGVATIPETAGAGRVANEDIGALVEATLTSLWGAPASGPYVDAALGSHVYFAPGVFPRVQTTPAARVAIERALVAVPGLSRVAWSDRLDAGDAVTRAIASGYRRERSGDLVVVPRPGWIVELRADADATTHGTMYDYDSRVPLFLLGTAVAPGHHRSTASPADIAPTLAKLAGIRFSEREGRVLSEALR
jgi:predicted AlkP superfamily pyrophosphatase or phosphodiesterase